MAKYYSVNIPTKAHLKKYVYAIDGSPVNFNSDSHFCMIVRAYMGKTLSDNLCLTDRRNRIAAFTDTIQVMFPVTKMRLYGFEIADADAVLINRFLEADFEKELVRFVENFIKTEGRYKGYKEAYEAFAEKYHIQLEEDILSDTLKKQEYRARKKYQRICSRNVPSIKVPANTLF